MRLKLNLFNINYVYVSKINFNKINSFNVNSMYFHYFIWYINNKSFLYQVSYRYKIIKATSFFFKTFLFNKFLNIILINF